MFGLYCRGDVPFRQVFVHAVIQDGEGRTMSKSKGNGVDPVDIIDSHGADALRFTLAQMSTDTQDIRMPVVKDPASGKNTSPKFDIGRNFANKIWNASRFILSNIDEGTPSLSPDEAVSIIDSDGASLEDRWILSRLAVTTVFVQDSINSFSFAHMAQNLYQFFWTDLCDWYLEIAKARIRGKDAQVQSILLYCLETMLKLLHPTMPFVTEEIWSKLPNRSSMLVVTPWPTVQQFHHQAIQAALNAKQLQWRMELIQTVTAAIRELHNRYPSAKGKPVVLKPKDLSTTAELACSLAIIEALAGTTIAENSPTAAKPADAATSVLGDVEIYIGGAVDKGAETVKLTKRKEELLKFIAGNKGKLSNEAFVGKAPAKVVQGLRDQLATQEGELAAVEKNLAELGA